MAMVKDHVQIWAESKLTGAAPFEAETADSEENNGETIKGQIGVSSFVFVIIVTWIVGLATAGLHKSCKYVGSLVGINDPKGEPVLRDWFLQTFGFCGEICTEVGSVPNATFGISNATPNVPGPILVCSNACNEELGVPIFFLFYLPIGGILVTCLYLLLNRYASETLRKDMVAGGMSQAKMAMAQGKSLTWKVFVWRFIFSVCYMGTGHPTGIEAPVLQIGAAVTTQIAAWLHVNNPDVMTLIAIIGCSAAVAAAFNTPIAGVTFALEEMMHSAGTNVLSVLSLGCLTATLTTRIVSGNQKMYSMGHSDSLSFDASDGAVVNLWLFVEAIIVGIVCGIMVHVQTRCLLRIRGYVKRQKHIPIPFQLIPLSALCAGFGCAAYSISGGLNSCFGIGNESIEAAMVNKLDIWQFFGMFFFKAIAVVFCYACGGPGGMLSPSIVTGGLLGGFVGHILHYFFGAPFEVHHCVFFGMAGSFSAWFRTPITSIILLYELTGLYWLVLPTIGCNFVASHLSIYFNPVQIYEEILRQDHIDLHTLRLSSRTVSVVPDQGLPQEEVSDIGASASFINTPNELTRDSSFKNQIDTPGSSSGESRGSHMMSRIANSMERGLGGFGAVARGAPSSTVSFRSQVSDSSSRLNAHMKQQYRQASASNRFPSGDNSPQGQHARPGAVHDLSDPQSPSHTDTDASQDGRQWN